MLVMSASMSRLRLAAIVLIMVLILTFLFYHHLIMRIMCVRAERGSRFLKP